MGIGGLEMVRTWVVALAMAVGFASAVFGFQTSSGQHCVYSACRLAKSAADHGPLQWKAAPQKGKQESQAVAATHRVDRFLKGDRVVVPAPVARFPLVCEQAFSPL